MCIRDRESIASNIRQYMTFAVLLTGNPVNALGNGIQGGSGVSIVINSKNAYRLNAASHNILKKSGLLDR